MQQGDNVRRLNLEFVNEDILRGEERSGEERRGGRGEEGEERRGE